MERLPAPEEKTDVAYQEVSKVVSIPRGVGLWGDMVVTLKNGDKVELRALDRCGHAMLGQSALLPLPRALKS